MAEKRKRTINFSGFETDSLINIIENRIPIIECKKTDYTSNKDKDDCWEDIARIFNEITDQTYRTAKELKCKYENIKRTVRIKVTKARASAVMDEDGSSSAVQLFTPAEERIYAWTSVDGVPLRYDGDTKNTMLLNDMLALPLEDDSEFSQENHVKQEPVEGSERGPIPESNKPKQWKWRHAGVKGSMSTQSRAKRRQASCSCNTKNVDRQTEAKLELLELQKENFRLLNREVEAKLRQHQITLEMMKVELEIKKGQLRCLQNNVTLPGQ